MIINKHTIMLKLYDVYTYVFIIIITTKYQPTYEIFIFQIKTISAEKLKVPDIQFDSTYIQ